MHLLDDESGVYENQDVRTIRFMGKIFKFEEQWEHAEAGIGSRYLLTDDEVAGNVIPFTSAHTSELYWLGK